MDSNLLKEELSQKGYDINHLPSCAEMFEMKFPYYLAIGMTYEQYWEQDCELVRHYRQAEEIRQEMTNNKAWLQGMYIYDAISRVSPILRSNGKKGAKAQPYVKDPYPINKKDQKEAEERREKENLEKGKRYMEAFAAQQNEKE